MPYEIELGALLRGERLDRAMIERLGQADRQALREMLSKYFSDEEVEGVLGRIDSLTRALEDEKKSS